MTVVSDTAPHEKRCLAGSELGNWHECKEMEDVPITPYFTVFISKLTKISYKASFPCLSHPA